MIKKELYEKTIKTLVNAYFNDTLAKGYCTACAVGNIIAGNCGYKVVGENKASLRWLGSNGKQIYEEWSEVFMSAGGEQDIEIENYIGESRRQIDSTGYSVLQLAKIEFAFETNGKDMFTGLMAVVDVLGTIHEVDKEDVQQAKNLFVKSELTKVNV